MEFLQGFLTCLLLMFLLLQTGLVRVRRETGWRRGEPEPPLDRERDRFCGQGRDGEKGILKVF